MITLVLLLAIACHGVQSDAILGRDLAAADAQFARVPSEARIAYAPIPGAQRNFLAVELKRIAARYGVEGGEFHDMCFEYPTRKLETAELASAMQESLKREGAQIEVTEFSLYPAPKGAIVFPLLSLRRPSPLHAGEPAMWRGYVEYSGKRKFAIWAKVRIAVDETRVLAAEDLPVGRPVQSSQLRVESLHGFPMLQASANTLEQVAGHTLRHAVRKDAPVLLEAIESSTAMRDVNRGEPVEVDVNAGSAHLKFEGRAESGGALGDTVTVRNAKSGKIFPARVAGKGKVEVLAGKSE